MVKVTPPVDIQQRSPGEKVKFLNGLDVDDSIYICFKADRLDSPWTTALATKNQDSWRLQSVVEGEIEIKEYDNTDEANSLLSDNLWTLGWYDFPSPGQEQIENAASDTQKGSKELSGINEVPAPEADDHQNKKLEVVGKEYKLSGEELIFIENRSVDPNQQYALYSELAFDKGFALTPKQWFSINGQAYLYLYTLAPTTKEFPNGCANNLLPMIYNTTTQKIHLIPLRNLDFVEVDANLTETIEWDSIETLFLEFIDNPCFEITEIGMKLPSHNVVTDPAKGNETPRTIDLRARRKGKNPSKFSPSPVKNHPSNRPIPPPSKRKFQNRGTGNKLQRRAKEVHKRLVVDANTNNSINHTNRKIIQGKARTKPSSKTTTLPELPESATKISPPLSVMQSTPSAAVVLPSHPPPIPVTWTEANPSLAQQYAQGQQLPTIVSPLFPSNPFVGGPQQPPCPQQLTAAVSQHYWPFAPGAPFQPHPIMGAAPTAVGRDSELLQGMKLMMAMQILSSLNK